MKPPRELFFRIHAQLLVPWIPLPIFAITLPVAISSRPTSTPDVHFRAFDEFFGACLAYVPRDQGPPADPYGFNAHMGACARALDTAAEEFVAALTCYYKQRVNAQEAAAQPQ